MPSENPSVSFVGELRYADCYGEAPRSVAAGLQEVSSFDPHTAKLDPNASAVITPAESPANLVQIQTPKAIRVRLNGGVEDITVNRALILFGEGITQVEIFNDQLATPKQQTVSVTFATGGPYT